ncbi:Rho-GTPase-activating protein 8 [Rhodotorula kratochvilovae]
MGDTDTAAEQPAPRPTLPPSFSNSFWSSDYRTGFTSLYDALDASLVQSDELVAHVQRRKDAEDLVAESLFPPALRQDGFAVDDGGSLRIGFEALLTQSVNEGRARQALADDLQRTILTPFSAWSLSHAGRVRSSRAQVEAALLAWERKRAQAESTKTAYDDACRAAALVEDEVNFSRAQGERAPGAAGGERARLPPRPDEIDGDGAPVAPAGAGVISALGRAFSTRRTAASAGSRARRDAKARKEDESESGEEDLREDADEEDDDKESPKSPAALREAREKARKVWEERAPEVKAGLDWSKTKFTNLLSTVVGPQNLEERLEKTLRDVAAAEDKYKHAVAELDSLRLTLEETLAANFAYVQRLESDRLRAAASVLKQFHAAVAALPKLIDGSLARVGQTLELVRPEKDLRGLIERRRTGPFQPSPVLYTSHYSEPALATFGIDLRKFDETNPEREQRPVPPVVEVLLREVEEKGKGVHDAERRKAWLYEVPLAAQHALRSVLNNPSTLALPPADLSALLAPFDLPVLCASLKLWLLELEVPVVTYQAYDELRALYPRRTAGEGEVDAEKVAEVVGKLPRVHFEVLRLLITHLSKLITSTTTPEPLTTYIHKLSLSLSRPLLRPKTETALTLDDRFPSTFLSTLLSSADELFAAAERVAQKGREERYRPRRQRTKPIDQRARRSNLGLGAQESVDLGRAGEVLKAQQAQRDGLSVQTASSALAVPQQEEGAFAASPMSATAEELPPAPSALQPLEHAEEEEDEQAADDRAAKEAQAAEEVRASSPGNAQPTEAAFVPPTEEAFVPPTEASFSSPAPSAAPVDDSQDEPSTAARAAAPAAAADEPLSSSSSLKRQSGTGRLRGARAPRPPSQVMARVAAFEGGADGDKSAKRESWTRTRGETPVVEGEREE